MPKIFWWIWIIRWFVIISVSMVSQTNWPPSATQVNAHLQKPNLHFFAMQTRSSRHFFSKFAWNTNKNNVWEQFWQKDFWNLRLDFYAKSGNPKPTTNTNSNHLTQFSKKYRYTHKNVGSLNKIVYTNIDFLGRF